MSAPLTVLATAPLPFVELLGRLWLAQVDVSQRLYFLGGRLALGVAESNLSQHLLQLDDALYPAARAALSSRLEMLLAAGSEGVVTILGGYIEDLTDAQIRCVEANARVAGSTGALLGLPPPAPALPPSTTRQRATARR